MPPKWRANLHTIVLYHPGSFLFTSIHTSFIAKCKYNPWIHGSGGVNSILLAIFQMIDVYSKLHHIETPNQIRT